MAQSKALIWDNVGEKFYEAGVDQGVLYPDVDSDGNYINGVAWNGLSAVNESPSGGEANDIYADNIKYLSLMGAEDFGFTIEAYTYPKEFEECDGSASIADGLNIGQQTRKPFGFCYRTKIGNDVDGEGHGYKLHLVYGCKAQPSSRDYGTINDSPEAITFSWEIDTTPVPVSGYKPTAVMTIDSTKVNPEKLATFLKILYGDTEAPKMLLPNAVLNHFAA